MGLDNTLNMDFSSIFLIQIIVTLVFTIVAATFDVKRNFIPDRLNYSLVVFGLISNLILTIFSGNIKFILASIISMVITFVVALLLWQLNLWAGGDVKLFTGIATVIPSGINIESLNICPLLSIYPFSFSVVINSIIVSFPFLFIFVFYNVIKKNLFNRNLDVLINIFNHESLIAINNSTFNQLIPVNNLKEGMIVNNYYFNDEYIYDLIKKENGNLRVYKANDIDYKYYFKSQSAGGITENEMWLLKIMYEQKIISKDISIKRSFPFAPSILLGFIIAVFCGDLMMLFTHNLFLVI